MHAKIPVLSQPSSAAFELNNCLLKISHIEILPNGLQVDKNAIPEAAYLENVNVNGFLFLSPCYNVKPNKILIRQYGKGNSCLMITGTLKELLKYFPPDIFVQIHASYIINKNYVSFISPNYEIYLFGYDYPLPIGRNFTDNVNRIFQPQGPGLHKRSHHKKY
jgi:LytTr DNA-binding domain